MSAEELRRLADEKERNPRTVKDVAYMLTEMNRKIQSMSMMNGRYLPREQIHEEPRSDSPQTQAPRVPRRAIGYRNQGDDREFIHAIQRGMNGSSIHPKHQRVEPEVHPQGTKEKKCYNCGEYGHIAGRCKLPQGSVRRQQRQ